MVLRLPPVERENSDPLKLEYSNLQRKRPNSNPTKSKINIKCCKERKHFAKKQAFRKTGCT
jgi:hypothetical protein